ncbi:hypothetical protein OCAE111667_15635 [Occultella aeris]|uniref:Uncharacterized protein n=1 Tax=Occultella aeris TaxID=2761496 RepID=A0A7M4DMV2_9MICO|nr:hypothetical protein [Occultella aeris]VZO38747.1 hypothetical protein HALOF300_03480 [Occultella aeris]
MRPVRRYAAPVTALVLATALGLGACSAGDDDRDSDTGTSSEEGAGADSGDSDEGADDATENDDATDTADDEAADGAGDTADAEVVPLEGTFVTEVSVPAGAEYEVTSTSATTLQLDFPAPADPTALSAFYEAWFTEQGMTVAEVSGIVTGTLGDATWTLLPQDAGSWILSAATL